VLDTEYRKIGRRGTLPPVDFAIAEDVSWNIHD